VVDDSSTAESLTNFPDIAIQEVIWLQWSQSCGCVKQEIEMK
jgi:hypothetical protein